MVKLTGTNITLVDRAIGSRHVPYVLAEMSDNHNGDSKRALALMEAAAEDEADA